MTKLSSFRGGEAKAARENKTHRYPPHPRCLALYRSCCTPVGSASLPPPFPNSFTASEIRFAEHIPTALPVSICTQPHCASTGQKPASTSKLGARSSTAISPISSVRVFLSTSNTNICISFLVVIAVIQGGTYHRLTHQLTEGRADRGASLFSVTDHRDLLMQTNFTLFILSLITH